MNYRAYRAVELVSGETVILPDGVVTRDYLWSALVYATWFRKLGKERRCAMSFDEAMKNRYLPHPNIFAYYYGSFSEASAKAFLFCRINGLFEKSSKEVIEMAKPKRKVAVGTSLGYVEALRETASTVGRRRKRMGKGKRVKEADVRAWVDAFISKNRRMPKEDDFAAVGSGAPCSYVKFTQFPVFARKGAREDYSNEYMLALGSDKSGETAGFSVGVVAASATEEQAGKELDGAMAGVEPGAVDEVSEDGDEIDGAGAVAAAVEPAESVDVDGMPYDNGEEVAANTGASNEPSVEQPEDGGGESEQPEGVSGPSESGDGGQIVEVAAAEFSGAGSRREEATVAEPAPADDYEDQKNGVGVEGGTGAVLSVSKDGSEQLEPGVILAEEGDGDGGITFMICIDHPEKLRGAEVRFSVHLPS